MERTHIAAWLVATTLVATLWPCFSMAQEVGDQPAAVAGADVGQRAPATEQVAPGGTGVTGMPAPVAVPAASEKRPPRLKSSAPPLELTVAPGANTVFSVALFHVNRIVTPFRNPEVRTSSAATMTVESGIVYVTTQTEDPIGLFVFDKHNPDQAISLTLNPAAISPVSVRVNLTGYSDTQPAYVISGNQKRAQTWEQASPYVETIKALFKELAAQRVPEGYGLSALRGRYAGMPDCAMPGLQIVPSQLVEGAEITAIVAKVVNQSYQPLEVNEAACRSPRFLGAATWPKTLLNPGEATELYIAVQSSRDAGGSSARPSVIGGGGH